MINPQNKTFIEREERHSHKVMPPARIKNNSVINKYLNKSHIPIKRRKKWFDWKKINKDLILRNKFDMDNYIRTKLNLSTFPTILEVRSKKITKWRIYLLNKLSEIKAKKITRKLPHWVNKSINPSLVKHLRHLYTKYDAIFGKGKKRNFFKTLKGTLATDAYIAGHKDILWEFCFRKNRYVKNFKFSMNDWRHLMFKYRQGSITTHLYHYKKKRIAPKFLYYKPKSMFCLYYTNYILYPWKNSILFKRYTYWGVANNIRMYTWKRYKKPYLRIKKPLKEKRNKLLFFFYKMFNAKRNRRHMRSKRAQQVLFKIISSFYGHIKLKNFKHLVKKTKYIKSNKMSTASVLLKNLEFRLDVLVYRLNLAPTIFWAQQLIKAGNVFILQLTKSTNWVEQYKNVRKIAFPLRLRNPKGNTHYSWLGKLPLNRFKFFSNPITDPKYKVRTGDLIFTSPNTKINKFFVTSELLKKPIPKNLLINSELKLVWNSKIKIPKLKNTSSWQTEEKHPLAAVILFHPAVSDFTRSDRIKKNYIRMLTL